MSTAPSLLKKPKAEPNNDDDNEPVEKTKPMSKSENGGGGGGAVDGEMPEEDSIVALIEHRTREVEHLKKKISYYKSQLVEAEKRLRESHEQLARVRARRKAVPSETASENGTKIVQLEIRSTSPIHVGEGSTNQPQCKTELVIPAVNPKSSQPVKSLGSGAKASSGPGPRSSPVSHSYTIAKVKPEKTDRSSSGVEVVEVEERGRKRKLEHKDRSSPVSHSHTIAKIKPEKTDRSSSDAEVVEVEEKGRKRKLKHKEHKELIPLVCSRLSPCTIHCHSSNHISSQHKRKMRSLALCPVNDQLFVTSALDGVVNLWQIQSRGSAASLLSSTDCMSSKHRRWPEDIAWHPLGNSLFSIYTADGGDSQISVLNLNRTQGRARVTFLEDKPHVKGIINSIMFMPWENTCFVTGGSDHAVVLWNERDAENSWKPKVLHRNLHSSAVMGVAGIQQKQVILSAGADKRIIGFDAEVGRAEFRYHLDSKCMSVLPNPCDYNLFMAQTGTPLRQLRLFDIRLRQTEIHAFGFKQESSDSQSALINQAWSPDGLYLTSGSVDPVIHIFDIRYNSQKPSQSIRAHQKRVFKAVWHYSLPLLVSISSDLHIGLHKII